MTYTTCFLSFSGGVFFDPPVSNNMLKCNFFETLESNNNIRNTKCIKWLFPYPSQACNTFYQSGFQLWTSRQSIFNEKKCMFCWESQCSHVSFFMLPRSKQGNAVNSECIFIEFKKCWHLQVVHQKILSSTCYIWPTCYIWQTSHIFDLQVKK